MTTFQIEGSGSGVGRVPLYVAPDLKLLTDNECDASMYPYLIMFI